MHIRHLLFTLLSCFTFAHADITEIMSMQELCEPLVTLLSEGTVPLMVFDIDDTLATTEQELGCGEWFYRELAEKQGQPGVDKQQVLKEVVAFYTHMHNYLPLKAVEPETPLFVLYLQSLGIPCIALTARSLLIERTFAQLAPLGIDLTLSAPYDNDLILSDNPQLPARYTRGIIFNGDNNKGETLVKFLTTINYKPEYVIYVDDGIKQVQRVHEALQKAGIPCSAFRYGYMDIFNKNLDKEKSQEQLAAFLQKHPYSAAA